LPGLKAASVGVEKIFRKKMTKVSRGNTNDDMLIIISQKRDVSFFDKLERVSLSFAVLQ